jgi:hypothetical protein
LGRESFEKREREKKRQQRSAEKRERRESRAETQTSETVDSEELMERFRVLSERHAAGNLSNEEYETEREQIFVELGLQ